VNPLLRSPAVGGNDETVLSAARELDRRREADRRLDSARFGMWLFLVAEVMLFAAFVGAIIVSRSSPSWPREGMADLPLLLPAANLLVLVASAMALELAAGALRRGARRPLQRFLGLALVLGAVFLAVQVVEYSRNWSSGFTLRTNQASNYFYVLAWVHGVHVLGGVVFLAGVTRLALKNSLHLARRVPLDLCRMYWHFVVLAWLFLFVLLYLS
jgi:heme/copper-type cytochrome/quinol oxidase subunit 3